MADFFEKHGYTKGTYEGRLAAEGYDVASLVGSKKYGKNINPNEYNRIRSTIESPYQKKQNQITTNINGINQAFTDLAGEKFEFNVDDYLPGINDMASKIYDPQHTMLDANAALQKSQLKDAKITTKDQFANRMQQEVEAINNRGAYFSGGAVLNEQKIRDQEQRSLFQLDMQGLAGQAQILAQKGMLSAEQAQFVQDQLMNSQSSAYQQFLNERGFKFDTLSKQYQINTDERNFLRGAFESDRSFAESTRQFEANYALNRQELELAREKFNFDVKKYGDQYALDAFKYKNAQAKSKKRRGGKKSSKKYSQGDIRETIIEMVNDRQQNGMGPGEIWHTVAEELDSFDVDIHEGSYADKALNTIFNLDYQEVLKSGYSKMRDEHAINWDGSYNSGSGGGSNVVNGVEL